MVLAVPDSQAHQRTHSLVVVVAAAAVAAAAADRHECPH